MKEQKLVTIICEANLSKYLISNLKELKISGYTIVEASGEGKKGARGNDWEQSRNIRIEIACDDEKAKKIIEMVKKKYLESYAIFLYVHNISVLDDNSIN
ncbi:nitrogen regulatory protein P-II [Melioribacter roseus P3M-2]|uniref:Nitrogen regulatory protein P-II n=1 Tax=Melioribacter roseus (strain DSM 23840 / JCM 17771 / VKM B-2668 / P3M-2) TaxID=1191523 RepID=I7A3Q2_MELRP|nr:DUF3240 family protein [Melioribacter roseus]AFN75843.1 nitrogen regulatory protein P-II [Melioribacter roseus P3M-2]